MADLNQALLSLFKVNPQLRQLPVSTGEVNMVPFDPEGSGYDYNTANQYGMSRDATGHLGSRVELDPVTSQILGLPPGSGIMLKGAGHETWGKALTGEAQAGYNVIKGRDGRYYSIPKQVQ